MKLFSTAFKNFEKIPTQHTAEGKDVSPHIRWEGVPLGTQSLALICEDPDAPHGTWDHWIIYNIPSILTELEEDITLPHDIQSCLNSWEEEKYMGPNPPSGRHRYFFELYALDRVIELPARSTKHDLLKAMHGHILEEVALVGTYQLQQ